MWPRKHMFSCADPWLSCGRARAAAVAVITACQGVFAESGQKTGKQRSGGGKGGAEMESRGWKSSARLESMDLRAFADGTEQI